MKAEERRNRILETLSVAARPVSAASLAADYSVSRQIIVGDIALLRAGGYEIAATPRGYMIPKNAGPLVVVELVVVEAGSGFAPNGILIGKCREHPESLPLSALTNGIHLHTILCPTEQAYKNVCAALARLGFLLDE